MSDLFTPKNNNANSSYTADDIEVLEGLEPVRRRPGMYIGGTDESAMHHLVNEIFDNAMDEAVAGFTELHQRAEKVFPPDHWFLAVIRGHLGLSFMQAKRYADAEPLLKQSYQVVQKQFGDEDARSKIFRSRLADLYTRWGKPSDAATYSP